MACYSASSRTALPRLAIAISLDLLTQTQVKYSITNVSHGLIHYFMPNVLNQHGV